MLAKALVRKAKLLQGPRDSLTPGAARALEYWFGRLWRPGPPGAWIQNVDPVLLLGIRLPTFWIHMLDPLWDSYVFASAPDFGAS